MNDNIYLNDEYFQNNPTWDVEDSPWKAGHVRSVIERLHLQPQTVAEIGCGAGEILNQLHATLPSGIRFTGFEISPKAHELCRTREKERLHYHLGSLAPDDHFDVLLVMDVFEHVDDYLGFLRQIHSGADTFIFHIPLDMSVRSVAKMTPIIHARNSVGHLHYFSKETALRTLTDCGYEIVEWFYTSGPVNRPPRMDQSGPLSHIAEPLKRFVFNRNPDRWVRYLGGSMLVVAK